MSGIRMGESVPLCGSMLEVSTKDVLLLKIAPIKELFS